MVTALRDLNPWGDTNADRWPHPECPKGVSKGRASGRVKPIGTPMVTATWGPGCDRGTNRASEKKKKRSPVYWFLVLLLCIGSWLLFVVPTAPPTAQIRMTRIHPEPRPELVEG